MTKHDQTIMYRRASFLGVGIFFLNYIIWLPTCRKLKWKRGFLLVAQLLHAEINMPWVVPLLGNSHLFRFGDPNQVPTDSFAGCILGEGKEPNGHPRSIGVNIKRNFGVLSGSQPWWLLFLRCQGFYFRSFGNRKPSGWPEWGPYIGHLLAPKKTDKDIYIYI